MTAKQKFDIGMDKLNENPWVMKVLVGALCVLGFFGNRTLIQYDETNKEMIKEFKELSTKLDKLIVSNAIQDRNVINNERRISVIEDKQRGMEAEMRGRYESMRDWVEEFAYKNFQRKI